MLKDVFMYDEGGVKPWVTYAVIALAVIVGGYFVYGAWTQGEKPQDVTMKCATAGCGYATSLRPAIGTAIPGKCPKCGRESVFVAHFCPKCKEPVVLNENLGLKPPTKCPKCGAEVYYGS